MSGAQVGLNAFAPSCYPTVARTTGVSWMLAMGRFGTILGILAIPAPCAAIAIASTRPAAGSFPREAAAH